MALESVRRVARDAKLPVYLVGGPIRDALLGVPVLDLDFTVEGDAVALARQLAETAGSQVTAHARFGTATVVMEGIRVDLVTSRRETYSQPGQLPRVTPGSVADDLARRDFSVNTMALPLSPDEAGLIDPMGGLDDLRAGVIRALHKRSFVDDPTRMLRAVRYEQRFGFRIEGATLEGMAGAVEAGYMDAVSGDRWRHELERILDESRPGPPLLRAADLGLLAGLHPALAGGDGLRRLAAASSEPAQADDWLAALFSPLSASDTESVIQRLRLSGRRAALARDTIEIRDSEQRIRATADRPSELARMLSGLDLAAESAWAKLTVDPVVAAALRRYADELRYVKPSLSGVEVLNMGAPQGPVVGEILARLRDARMDGLVKGEEEERDLARALLSACQADVTK